MDGNTQCGDAIQVRLAASVSSGRADQEDSLGKVPSAGYREATEMNMDAKPTGVCAAPGASFTDAELRVLINLAEDGIICVGSDQRIVLFNTGAEKLFGFTAEEALGEPLDLLLPAECQSQHRGHVRSFAMAPESTRWMSERVEVMGRHKDGSEFPAEVSISKAQINNEWLFTAIVRDVSERKRAEEAIRNSLREKEVLLQEIHHRVKNNLQIVSSLLSLQARTCQDLCKRKIFQDCKNRVHSMALLHEQLYQHGNLSDIDCHRYVKEITAHLFHSYGVTANQIEPRLEINDMHMNIEQAVPLGLILNELVSNCLKHAFPNQRTGHIRIALHGNANRPEYLIVEDDGVGVRDNRALNGTSHLGMRLVNILADQIGATVEVTSNPSKGGTRVNVKFNEPGRRN